MLLPNDYKTVVVFQKKNDRTKCLENTRAKMESSLITSQNVLNVLDKITACDKIM